jgi:hypothetical protein
MTWTIDKSTGELTAPWGEVVATIDKPFRIPGDVQDVAESMFRDESMAEMGTGRIADYAQAWMGDVEVSDG